MRKEVGGGGWIRGTELVVQSFFPAFYLFCFFPQIHTYVFTNNRVVCALIADSHCSCCYCLWWLQQICLAVFLFLFHCVFENGSIVFSSFPSFLLWPYCDCATNPERLLLTEKWGTLTKSSHRFNQYNQRKTVPFPGCKPPTANMPHWISWKRKMYKRRRLMFN